jgi:hypothetical protein
MGRLAIVRKNPERQRLLWGFGKEKEAYRSRSAAPWVSGQWLANYPAPARVDNAANLASSTAPAPPSAPILGR